MSSIGLGSDPAGISSAVDQKRTRSSHHHHHRHHHHSKHQNNERISRANSAAIINNGNSNSTKPSTANNSNTKNQRTKNARQKTPYRVFGKRLLRTSQFVVSSRIWLHTIPTRNCDVLMTFPPNAEDAKLMWILKQLREKAPEIIVHVRHHARTEVFGFYMTSSYVNLLKGAEILGFRKPLKKEYGGGMKEFSFDDQDFFEGIHNEHEFLTSQERQSIVYNMINNLRSNGNEQLGEIEFREGQAIIPTLLTKKIIRQVFPLHNSDDLMELRTGWVNAFFRSQPLNRICEYFGVKIAMYFAYLGHYTTALCIPALIGVIMWLAQGYDQTFDAWCFVGFALFNVLWATLYLEHWKRRSAELAYKWGTLDKHDELIEDPRPFYTGELEVSNVTGRLEPFYPVWKRNCFRYFVTVPVVCISLLVVFVVMLANFYLEEFINQLVSSGEYAFIAKVLPKICHASSIFALDRMYTGVAYWLNDMENYRMQEAYENHLIIKLVLFQFVNSFLSLFYIAFYLQDMDLLRQQLMALLIVRQVIGNFKEALLPYLMWHLRMIKAGLIMTAAESPEKECSDQTPMENNIGSDPGAADDLMGSTENLINGNLDASAKPDEEDHSDTKMSSNTEKDLKNGKGELPPDNLEGLEGLELPARKPSSNLSPSQAEVESTMSQYEDTFEDYLEMFIQFGYVTLFSSAFPLAALCALLNNIIEIRSDAFKLCITCRRPFGQRVENIGTWADALMLMGVLAVIVNCALIGVFGHVRRMVPGLDGTSYLLLIIILEHVILAVKMWIAYAIPDIPRWVATEMSRLDFLRREAFKKIESQQTPSAMNSQHSSPKIHSRSATPTHSIARSNSAPVTSSSSPPGSSHAVHPTTSSEENCMPAGEVAYITRPSTFQDSLSESLLRHRHISEMAQKEADDVCHTESTSGSQMCLPSETTYSSGGTDKSQ